MTIVRWIIALAVWAGGVWLLERHELLSRFTQIDNPVGMAPVALTFTIVAIVILLLARWQAGRLTWRLGIPLGGLALLFALLFPVALHGNWWLRTMPSDAPGPPFDLTAYAPFAEGTRAARLDTVASLRLSDNLPLMDGATALYPLYAAFAQAVYDSVPFRPERVICTNTSNAYRAIIAGERDVIFVAAPSGRQSIAAREAGVELHFTPVGREAFVFIVGRTNPVENLSYQQIRDIYSGKTARWHTLGWSKGGRIVAFQRPEGSGSHSGLQGIMGGLPIQAPQPLPRGIKLHSQSLMELVSIEWRGVQPAIGYSYRYFATAMLPNPDDKLLNINGISPSIEHIRNGSYPFTGDFYAVTNGPPQGNTARLIEWVRSPQGQRLVELTGYVPL